MGEREREVWMVTVSDDVARERAVDREFVEIQC